MNKQVSSILCILYNLFQGNSQEIWYYTCTVHALCVFFTQHKHTLIRHITRKRKIYMTINTRHLNHMTTKIYIFVAFNFLLITLTVHVWMTQLTLHWILVKFQWSKSKMMTWNCRSVDIQDMENKIIKLKWCSNNDILCLNGWCSIHNSCCESVLDNMFYLVLDWTKTWGTSGIKYSHVKAAPNITFKHI